MIHFQQRSKSSFALYFVLFCWSVRLLIINYFAERVGGDGFHDIIRARGPCKLIWVLLFLTAWALVLYQIFSYVSKYLNYPVDTKVELEFDENAAFPAVSFCNLNPVRYSLAKTMFHKEMKMIINQEPQESLKKHNWDETKDRFHSKNDDFHMEDYEDYEYDYDFLTDSQADYIDEENLASWIPEYQPDEVLLENAFYQGTELKSLNPK